MRANVATHLHTHLLVNKLALILNGHCVLLLCLQLVFTAPNRPKILNAGFMDFLCWGWHSPDLKFLWKLTVVLTFLLQCCWNCGRKASETCSGCNAARYCGSFCQHKDWERHHLICSPGLQAQPKSVSAITSSRVASVTATAAAAAGVPPVGLSGVKVPDSMPSVSSPSGEKALVASRSSTPSTPASVPETNGH